MVFEDIGDGVLIIVFEGRIQCCVGNLVEGIVVWCEDLRVVSPKLFYIVGDIFTVTPEYDGNCSRISGYFCSQLVQPFLNPHIISANLYQTIKRRQVLLSRQQRTQIRDRSLSIHTNTQPQSSAHQTSPTITSHLSFVRVQIQDILPLNTQSSKSGNKLRPFTDRE